MSVWVQNVRRELEWVPLSLQRYTCVHEPAVTLLPGHLGQQPAGLQPQRRGHLVVSGSELMS